MNTLISYLHIKDFVNFIIEKKYASIQLTKQIWWNTHFIIYAFNLPNIHMWSFIYNLIGSWG